MSGKGIGILIDFRGTQFELSLFKGKDPALAGSANANSEVTSLLLAVNDPDGAEINLVDGILKLLETANPDPTLAPLDRVNFNSSFTTVILYGGSISFRKDSLPAPGSTGVGISGQLGWKPEIEIGGGEKLSADLDASFQFYKEKSKKVSGFIEGMLTAPIPGIEFLSVGVRYVLPTDLAAEQIVFLLEIGPVKLAAAKQSIPPARGTGKPTIRYTFTLNTNDENGDPIVFTLGDLITFFASLIDPSIDKFEFDPPFDFITDLDIAGLANGLNLLLELRPDGQKVVGFRVPMPANFGIPGIMTITAVSLKYEGKKGKKDLNLHLEGIFLGNNQGARWDPVNGVPPEVPKQKMAFLDLRYLGIGQHVSIKNAQHAKDVGEIMRMLSGSLSESEQKLIAERALRIGNPLNSFMGTDSPIEFNADSEILIGLDITMLQFLSLSIIFNDPILYGLRIELGGEKAKNFAGLKFEILYQKINDTTGKYHIDLTLPDFVRHFTVGAVSVTLPVIVVDIFTNGDFKLDLGFPWQFNFARSFAIEVFPFTGAGGFYFNKLSSATAISTPRLDVARSTSPALSGMTAIEKRDHSAALVGEFTPVYEFGLGLRIGLGKTFTSGPFRAEISITIQGLIEGVFSYYNSPSPNADALAPYTPDKELFFMIKGGVALVGRLYGAVDFKVIKVEVEVLIEAMIKFYIETYKPIEVLLSARVSVRASVKVLFVKVHFKFSLTVEQEFIIESPQGLPSEAPWYNYLA